MADFDWDDDLCDDIDLSTSNLAVNDATKTRYANVLQQLMLHSALSAYLPQSKHLETLQEWVDFPEASSTTRLGAHSDHPEYTGCRAHH